MTDHEDIDNPYLFGGFGCRIRKSDSGLRSWDRKDPGLPVARPWAVSRGRILILDEY